MYFKKIFPIPLYHIGWNHWYKTGWIHNYILFTLNSGSTIQMLQQETKLIKPGNIFSNLLLISFFIFSELELQDYSEMIDYHNTIFQCHSRVSLSGIFLDYKVRPPFAFRSALCFFSHGFNNVLEEFFWNLGLTILDQLAAHPGHETRFPSHPKEMKGLRSGDSGGHFFWFAK